MLCLLNTYSRYSNCCEMFAKNPKSVSYATDCSQNFPRHQTLEACRKLGMTLPPVPLSLHNQSRKNSSKTDSKPRKTSPAASITIGKKLSDYVKKPVYFCHPLTTNQTEESKKDGKKFEAISPLSENHSQQLISATICQKINRKHQSKSEKLELEEYNRRHLLNHFKEFCKQEGYDVTSSVFEKTSVSFKRIKKFTKISKPPHDALWPIKENFFGDDDLGPQLCKPTLGQDTPKKKAEKIPNKRIIKENARQSAEQGRTAASKAISFILSDKKQTNRNKRKRVLLPPLERSSLHAFTNTWNPDASLPVTKIT